MKTAPRKDKLKRLDPKKVMEEFNERAMNRVGINKVLSDRYTFTLNKKFHADTERLIKKCFSDKIGRVVDIGTGMGRLALHFSKISNGIVGVDFANRVLSLAEKLLECQRNVTLLHNDAVDIDFLPHYFDLGVASLVLKHNNDKRTIQIIEKLKKWCKSVLLIEHVSGGANGSDIAIMRNKSWYLNHFLPMKPITYHQLKRGKDKIIFCILR